MELRIAVVGGGGDGCGWRRLARGEDRTVNHQDTSASVLLLLLGL